MACLHQWLPQETCCVLPLRNMCSVCTVVAHMSGTAQALHAGTGTNEQLLRATTTERSALMQPVSAHDSQGAQPPAVGSPNCTVCRQPVGVAPPPSPGDTTKKKA